MVATVVSETSPRDNQMEAMEPPPTQAPAMSPSLHGTRSFTGRRLRQRVMDELKNVRRKSPVPEKNMVPPPLHVHVTPNPPPLELNPSTEELRASSSDDEQQPRTYSTADEAMMSTTPEAGGHNDHQGKGKRCYICDRSFTVFHPKHSCKICGKRVCDDCSKTRVKLNRRLERKKGSRLCDPCARTYVQTNTPMMTPESSPQLSPSNNISMPRRQSVPKPFISSAMEGKALDVSGSSTPLPSPGSSSSSPSEREKVTISSYEKTGLKRYFSNSHLRLRHWISLAVIAFLVVIRIMLDYKVASSLSASSAVGSTGEEEILALVVVPWYVVLARRLDYILSMRVFGSYIVGLVVFDEICRSRNKDHMPVRKRVKSGAVRGNRAHSTTSTASRKLVITPMASPRPREHEDDEVLEVDMGEKSDHGGFNFDKMSAIIEDCAINDRTDNNEVRLSNFLMTCEMICGFVLVFGRATSFAGSAVNGYVTSIGTNLATWPVPSSGPASWHEQAIRVVVEREVELKVANVGGKKKPSCSRCVLRLLWFVEFVEACIRHTLTESQEEHTSAGAGKAYEETIGQRHPWIVRKGVMSALGSIPTRSTILSSLNLDTSDESISRLVKTQGQMKSIVMELQALYKKHNLEDLK